MDVRAAQKLGLCIVCLLASALANTAEPVSTGAVLENALAAYAKLHDYTCMLSRKELVNGIIKEQKDIRFEFKKPGYFYMKWAGDLIQQAVYIDGKNDNKLMLRGGGLFRFVTMSVDPSKALKYNRHPIVDADIGHILKIFEANYRRARVDKEAIVKYEHEEQLDGRNTWLFRALLPPDKGYYGHRINVHIDQTLRLPIRIEVFGWNDELLEMYHYSDLKLNVGLSDDDFDLAKHRHRPESMHESGTDRL